MEQTTSKPTTDVYWLDTGQVCVWFNVTDGVVENRQGRTAVPFDKFITFLQTAQELGMKSGKL